MRGAKKCSCSEPVWMVKGAPLTDPRRAQAGRMQAWHEAWAREALRVAKPGAYLLAFGGTRTVHRMTCAIEDAGWIIRDMLVWGYASGFPKGRANLKPAWEPIVMARKPGPLRMLNIDECRIKTNDSLGGGAEKEMQSAKPDGWDRPWRHDTEAAAAHSERIKANVEKAEALGRWPANVILTDPIFDGGWDGVVGGGETAIAPPYRITAEHVERSAFPVSGNGPLYGDSGTYSRFFLVPKAARSDREPVLGGLPEANPFDRGGPSRNFEAMGSKSGPRANVHPTVKPTELMRHLVRLVTPPGGTVLDPFLGSGTTALAAEMEGFAWVGIEKEAEYVQIAEARLNGTQKGLGL
jgi:hypothetical protein